MPRIVSKSYAKTGKHGAAKALIVTIDPVTGEKKEMLLTVAEARELEQQLAAAQDEAAGAANAQSPAVVEAEIKANVALSLFIKKANANGSFSFEALTALLPRLSLDKLRAALPAGVTGSVAEGMLCTAVACALFETRFAAKKVSVISLQSLSLSLSSTRSHPLRRSPKK